MAGGHRPAVHRFTGPEHEDTGYVGAFRPVVASTPILNDRQIVVPDLGPPLLPGAPPITVTPVTLHPRPAILAALDELIAHPTDFLAAVLGILAANRSR